MRALPTSIPEVVRVIPRRIGDSRGYFAEVFKDGWFRDNISDVTFVQDNQSLSANKGTLRGLHYQAPPFAQGKLVQCVQGSVFDVAVDIRLASPTFGKWVGAELSADNGEQLWIPPGFAHGFETLADSVIIQYKVTAPYSAEHDRGIRWNDPAIGVEWMSSEDSRVLSDKDLALPNLADITSPF